MDGLKTYYASEVTNDTIILKSAADLKPLYALIKKGEGDFILSWKKQSVFGMGKPKEVSKVMSAPNLKDKLDRGELKLYANGLVR